MGQYEVHLRPGQAVWLVLMLVFATTAIIQLRLAVQMDASWGLWTAGGLTLAATGCSVALRHPN
jgi:hypothetical protein